MKNVDWEKLHLRDVKVLYGTSWDDDEGYYEVDVDLRIDDELLIESLSSYLDVNEDENGELTKE